MFRGLKQEENIHVAILLVLLIESQEAEKALQLKSLHNATEKNSLNSKQNGIEEGEKRHREKNEINTKQEEAGSFPSSPNNLKIGAL